MNNLQFKDTPGTAVRDRQVSTAGTGLMSPASTMAWGEIVHHWRFMVLVFVACVGATAGYVSLVPPKWEASAHILFSPASADDDLPGLGLISGSVDPARSLQTAIALLNTPTADVATAARLGAPWSPASVDQSIVLEPLGESYVVEVKAQADSAPTAARLATAFVESALGARNSEIKQRAAVLLAQHNGLPATAKSKLTSPAVAQLELFARIGDPSMSMAQPAFVPSSPVGLPAQYKIALSAVLGLCLAIAGAWARARGTRPDDAMPVPAQPVDDRGWDK